MKKILERLYDGEIFPAEQINVCTEEYKTLRRQHYKHCEDFAEMLKKISLPLEEQFKSIRDEQLYMASLEMAETYISGFRLGARMMLEIIAE